MKKELTKAQEVERSLIKRFRKEIWTKFILALKRYDMIAEGDKIAVCISGGKDSVLLAKLFQMLKKISDVNFDVEYISMNPGYNEENLKLLKENAEKLEIPLTIFETNIFDLVYKMDGSPCYVCARMRRGYLYKKAQELGCNKIALAHHFTDVVVTTVMAMFYGAQLQAMPPKVVSKNFEGMEIIRPLYCIDEEDIIKWKNYNNLQFLQCACRFTEACEVDESLSARAKVKALLKDLEKDIPALKAHIFKSVHNVDVDTMVGVKHKGEYYDFEKLFNDRKK